MAEYSFSEIVTREKYGSQFLEYVDFMNEAIDLAHRTHSLRQVMDRIANGQELAILAAIDDWLSKKKEYEQQRGAGISYSAIQMPQLDIGIALLEALELPTSPDLSNYRQAKKSQTKNIEQPKHGFVYLQKYAEFRVRGEWFRLNEVHIRQIVGLFEGKNG